MTAEDRPGNLHLICSPCLRLAAPVHWDNCHLQVQCCQADDGSSIFRVRDEPAKVAIACRQIAVAENVEPMY